jgi:polyferredoxin
MGLIQDVLGRFPKLRAMRLHRFGRIDRWLKNVKYIMLVITLLAFFALNDRFAVPVRGSSNWSIESLRVAWLTYDAASRWRVIIILFGVVVGLVVTRAWCRYLCPLGALLTIGNRINLFRLRKDSQVCTGCGKYPRECRTYTTPGTADCILCGDCIDGCPRHGVVFSHALHSRSREQEVFRNNAPGTERADS